GDRFGGIGRFSSRRVLRGGIAIHDLHARPYRRCPRWAMQFRRRGAASAQHARVNRLDYALALISGALLALSFPKFGHPAFAWIALTPLLLAFTGWNGRPGSLRGIAPMRAFVLRVIAGMCFFLGTVYWTGTVIVTFGDVPVPVAAIGVVLMSAYLSLYHVV